MATFLWVVIGVVVVAVIVAAVAGARRRRTVMLRERFGPEYDRAVQDGDGRRAAEADLRAREKERAQFDVLPLPEATRLGFADEWSGVQASFVDQPEQAVAAADALIITVMQARGYPMRDFDAQAELVSVDHPDVVENYRFAHAVRERSHTQQAGLEDLREALLRYRSLFDELLRPENGSVASAASAAQPPATGPEPGDAGTGGSEQADGPAALDENGLAGLDGKAPRR